MIAALTLLLAMAGSTQPAAPAPPPGPYVNVYHDDQVTFQVRRDHITLIGEKTYQAGLRWLWATPVPYKGHQEVARVIIVELDCGANRVRELRTIRRNREGQIFDREEKKPEEQTWRAFDPKSGAAAALGRVCEFLPELLRQQQEQQKP